MNNLHPIFTTALQPFIAPTRLFQIKESEIVDNRIVLTLVKGIEVLPYSILKPAFETWLKRNGRIKTTIPEYWEAGEYDQDLYDYIVTVSPFNSPFN
jgi:hypothetical protein